ncbi:MAG TPA: hypothetical protein DIT05_16845 [Morganella sp. (in: Bacteria)]|nr:hypothetical protein [Morganella sp. (in: enterobacteria)]
MKELTTQQVNEVNGGLLGLGLVFGGIGAAVGLSPILATTGIGMGVVSIVDNAKSIRGQKKGFF